MTWYKEFYAGESIEHKKEKIKWKIIHNAGQLDIYVIALSSNHDNLLDIVSAKELLQKAYPKQDMLVVGVDKGYDNALELAAKIIMDVFQKTGSLDVRKYFLQQQKKMGSTAWEF